jgi:hypothetical protein
MRVHLFEWEDQAWFPASLRAAMTSYLATAYRITPLPKHWANCLSKLMSRDEVTEIVDLGSGSGGPVGRVVKELAERGFKACVTLTDLYPNVTGPQCRADGESSIRWWPEPVDASKVPAALPASARCSRRSTTSGHRRRGGSCATRLSGGALSAFSRNLANTGFNRIGVAHSFACSCSHAFGETGILGADYVHLSCADFAVAHFLGRSGFAASNLFGARIRRVHAGSPVNGVRVGGWVD